MRGWFLHVTAQCGGQRTVRADDVSCHHMGPADGTRVTRFSGRPLYLLSHLTGPWFLPFVTESLQSVTLASNSLGR